MTQTDELVDSLCVNCALCCDGTLFGDVELPPTEDVERLRRLGLGLRRRGDRVKLPQPCRALDGCRCGVYDERPVNCARFECLLLQATRRGERSVPDAQRIIRSTRRSVAEIRNLLAGLGDDRHSVPLGRRVRDTMKRVDPRGQPGSAEGLWKLGERYHRLTLRLSEHFHPGE